MLALDVCPMSWPVGMGGEFEGIYDLATNRAAAARGAERASSRARSIADHRPRRPAARRDALRRRRSRAARGGRAGAGRLCDVRCRAPIAHGDLTPVYFGSALKEFGVDDADRRARRLCARRRAPQPAEPAPVAPDARRRHRLRLQGAGEHGPAAPRPHRLHAAVLGHVQARHEADARPGTASRSRSTRRSCSSRRTARSPTRRFPATSSASPTTARCASATRCARRADVRFTGLPNFAPEILRRVALKDPTKTKQLRKALDDMAEEGVTQVFYPEIGIELDHRRGRPAPARSAASPARGRI